MTRKQSTRLLLLVFCLSILGIVQSFAQIEVEPALSDPRTPENLIREIFAGKGIDILSVNFVGDKNALGYFKNGTADVGLSEGFMMSTGRAALASTPNINEGDGQPLQGVDQEPLISGLALGELVQDLAMYEIEFIPKRDTIEFKYVFASEEYPEFGCNCFNDVFGFFLQGPGYSDWTNLAIVPGTVDEPVSVRSIHPLDDIDNRTDPCNNGAPRPDCAATNEHLYVDNKGSTTLTYDGLTTVLTAKTKVEPCQTYKIKLAIADVGDALFDSAIFFDANSFGTDELEVKMALESIDGTLIEGCAGGQITFSFNKPVPRNYRINITGSVVRDNPNIDGDYTLEPLQDFIRQGEKSLTLNIRPLIDPVDEGLDSLGFMVDINDCESETYWFYIRENDLEKVDLGEDGSICPGDSLQLDGEPDITLPVETSFTTPVGNINIKTIDDNGTSSDNEPTVSSITVSDVQPADIREGLIKEICVNVGHNNIEDIDLILESPSGQLLELSTDNGGEDRNYTATCFSPDALTLITDGTAPFTGSFQPEGDWQILNGGATNGDWKLYVKDDKTGDDGVLRSWSITFNPLYALQYSWTPTEGLSCSDCPNPKAAPNSETEYILAVTDSYGCIVRDSVLIKTNNDTLDIAATCIEETQNSITFGWETSSDITTYEVNIDGQGWITPSGVGAHTVTNLAEGDVVNLQVRGTGACTNVKGAVECMTSICFPPDASIDRLIDLTCAGADDGRIDLLSDEPNVVFIIDQDTSFTKRFSNLPAGDYEVIALDTATTCTIKLDATIGTPDSIKIDTFAIDASCGGADGLAAVSISGGTEPYNILWTIGVAEDTIRNQAPGVYTVQVTDDFDCEVTQTVTIGEDTTPTTSGINIFCAETTSTSVTFEWDPVPGIPQYEVQIGEDAWRDPTSSTSILVSDLNILEDVQIRVRGASDCITALDSMTCMTTDCTPPTGSFDRVNEGACTDYTDGALSIASTSPNLVYILNTDTSTTGVFTDLPPGDYSIELLDTLTACTNTIDTVLINPLPLNVELFDQSENCGETDGIAAVNVTGGEGPYQIIWDNGETTDTIKNLSAETYTATIIDSRGCSTTRDIIVDLTIDNLTDLRVQVSCPRITNNSIDVTWEEIPTVSDYEVQINNGEWTSPNSVGFTHQLTDLGFSEVFDIKVRGNSDCGGAVIGNQICATSTCLPLIGGPPTIVRDISCNGMNDGEIDVFINTLPFNTPTTLPFVVRDSAGFNVIDYSQDSTILLVSATSGFVIVGEDTLRATELNPMVTFKDLEPGSKTIAFWDSTFSCNSTQQIVIGEPDTLGIITNFIGGVSCDGLADGVFASSVLGGAGPYEYTLNGESTSSEIHPNLTAGDYEFVITDANGCEVKESFTIEDAPVLIDTTYQQNLGCGETDSGVAGLVTSFSGDYQVTWDNGTIGDTISNLSAGSYKGIITTDAGCTDSVELAITDVDYTLEIGRINPLCGNENSATAVVTAGAYVTAIGNPAGDYSYEWSDPNSQTTDTAFALTPGDYTVTVTDNTTGCSREEMVFIVAPDGITVNNIQTAETCLGLGDGSVIFDVQGGVPGYSYDWGDNFFRADPGRSDLNAGDYVVTITDQNGCTVENSFTITAPENIAINFMVDSISCATPTGSATAVITGGSGNFSYLWNDDDNQTSIAATDLEEGTFDLIVTDESTGCNETASVTIGNIPPVVINTSSTPSFCRESATGTASVEITGGSGNYRILWDDPLAQETATAENLNAGDYMVLVIDDSGCEESQLVTVAEEANSMEVNFNVQNITCNGTANGMAEVMVTGNGSNYTYTWSTGSQSRSLEDLPGGEYMVTVSDDNGCSSVSTIMIEEPAFLTGIIDEQQISCKGENDGNIEILAEGGTAPFTYSINGSSFSESQNFPNLRENIYQVLIKDSNGCEVDLGTVNIEEPEEINVVLDRQLIAQSGSPISLDSEVQNAQGEVSYSWESDGEQESIICDDCDSPLVSPSYGQAYTVTVTDEMGCTAASTVNLLVRQTRGINVPSGFSPNEDGFNDLLTVHGTEGTQILSFQIFDRWGELVYQNDNFLVNERNIGWDGKYRGDTMNGGVFTWVAEVQYLDGVIEIAKGHTTLIK